jgi:hypothetical protein
VNISTMGRSTDDVFIQKQKGHGKPPYLTIFASELEYE